MSYKYFKILRFVFYPLYLISFIVPRKKCIWLFGAHQNRYAENSKALYEYVSTHSEKIQAVWITDDKDLCKDLSSRGFLAYRRWSLKGLFYSLSAKYYFYNVYSDDINFYTSGGVTLVNLWHGIPLKQIEFDIKKGPLRKMFNSRISFVYAFFKPYIFHNPNFVLSTSSLVSSLLSSAFRVSPNQCLEFGYPRCDTLFSNIYSKIDVKSKTIVYIPTWRSEDKNFLATAIKDFILLNEQLKKNNYKLIIKLHPNTKEVYENYSCISFYSEKMDVNELLKSSDFLMTDYSSVYFDYLHLDREIIFYAFDYEKYLKEDRELYFNYEEVTPGEKVYTFESLVKLLDNLEDLDYKKERKKIYDDFWKDSDGNASKRVYDYFKAL